METARPSLLSKVVSRARSDDGGEICSGKV